MLKIFKKIVQSKQEPEFKNVLWNDGHNLMVNRRGIREKANPPMSPEVTERIITALDKNGESAIEFTQNSVNNLKILENLRLDTKLI